jgi:cytochrome c-type biogenesis protein CcmH
MTFAAVAAVLSPYIKSEHTSADASDLEVYKDQLKEIDADEKRGVISSPEASNARIEVSRRILKAHEISSASPAATDQRLSKIILITAALGVPIVSWGLYAKLGAPERPDLPIATRTNTPSADPTMDVLVAKAEEHLKANPNDGRGWEVLAPIYFRLARYQDAIKAYETAGRLKGPSASYEIGIGQAWSRLNGGFANDAARAAFQRALDIDPSNPEPKLLLATDLAQQGKFAQAKDAFEAMLATAPADAPWRPMLMGMIARVDAAMASNPSAKAPSPTQADIDQAAEMSPSDRIAMIENMVAQLDAKLVETPTDKEGWKRLLRSYLVLNKPDEAQKTLERAKIGLKDLPAALNEINALAAELGIAKL